MGSSILRQRPVSKLRGTATIDLDGTLAKSHERVLELEMEGHEDSWNEIRMFTHAWKEPKRIMPVNENLAESLDRVAESWKVVLLTSTSGGQNDVCAFLEMHRLRFDELIFERLGRKLPRILGTPEIRVHFDDDQSLAYSLGKMGRHAILFDREYNQGLMCNGKIQRMKNWSEAVSLLRNI